MDFIRGFDKKIYVIAALAILVIVASVLIYVDPTGKVTHRPERVQKLVVYDSSYDSVSLKWEASPRAEKYTIYRSDNKMTGYEKIKTVKDTKYTDVNLDTGQEYWYRVLASNDIRKSRNSKKVSMTPNLKAPKLSAVSSGDGVLIKIEEIPGADGYVLYRDEKEIAKGQGLEYLDDDTEVKEASKYTASAYRTVDDQMVSSPVSHARTASRSELRVSLDNFQEVPELVKGDDDSYSVAGKVKSNATISKIMVGVAGKDNDEWVSKETNYEDSKVNKKEYDINVADENIAMETLPAGEYRFMVVAEMKDGTVTTLKDQEFKVREATGGEKIVQAALECAWPEGTPSSKYKYSGGSPTPAYKSALSQAYGSRSSWGAQTRAGASCDVFVGTVVRVAGVDPDYPRGLDGVISHCSKHPEIWEDLDNKSEENLMPGDIIYQEWSSGGHTCVYLGDGKVAQAHYVAQGGTYGEIDTYKNSVQSASKCSKYHVYRSKK